MIYFTSDQHYFHYNIMKHCNRPFKDIEEMHAKLIYNYNSLVTDDDHVYMLGDFSFRQKDINEINKLFDILNGKIHLIAGNHDMPWISKLSHPKVTVEPLIHKISYNTYNIILCHYPIESWPGKYRDHYHFHGHSHGKASLMHNRIDVGVDQHNYSPISLEEAITLAASNK